MKYIQSGGVDADDRAEEHDEELVGSNIDGGSGEDEPAEVQPCGSPTPAFSAKERTPMVQSARSWECGSDMSHAKRYE